MSNPFSRSVNLLIVALLALLVGACSQGEGEVGPEGAAQEAGADQQGASAGPVAVESQAPARPDRGAVIAGLGAELATQALSRAVEQRMTHLLEVEGRVPLRSWRRGVMAELYGEHGYQLVFVEPGATEVTLGETLVAELSAASHHALDAEPYRLPRIDELRARVDALALPSAPEWGFTEATIEDVAAAVERGADLSGAATGLLAGPTELRTLFDGHVSQLSASIGPTVELELLLADAFMSYARDMALGNTNRLSEGHLLEVGGAGQVVADRLREAFREVATLDVAGFGTYLEGLIPKHPQYSLLMANLSRYREIVDAGGWSEVRPRELRMGRTHSRVGQLKNRLAVEGFYEGPIDNVYDEALHDAVTAYQETHQMTVTGETHNLFWSSINVPAERRLRQIEVTLGRWRESRIGDDDYYIFINVPDFHGELWRDGERLHRWRVVTGNRTQECDPETNRMRYANATPLISAQVEYLVYNPYWNVPERIRREELDLELMENPAWLTENGYEIVVTTGAPRIRQLPGEDNALGAVKFIFPNDHNIYMHDTPNRRYFDFPIRAYSHGCIRVHEPLQLAQILLTQDGSWDEERINGIRELGTERVVRLQTPVPVHIEYYVVTVDEQGRPHFLSDIYRYDRVRMGELPEEGEECDLAPEVDEALVVWNDDGTAQLPDGTQVLADGSVVLSEQRLAGEEGLEVLDGDPTLGQAPSDAPSDAPAQQTTGQSPDPGDIGP